MTHLFRALALSLVRLALAASASASSPIVSTPQDTSALEFYGFRAGARIEELDSLIRRLDGGRLRCDRAKRDRRVSECRGTIRDSALGGAVKVWVSAIDSVAGVITISGGVNGELLDRWRSRIEARYGRVGARAQGSQWMMQWPDAPSHLANRSGRTHGVRQPGGRPGVGRLGTGARGGLTVAEPESSPPSPPGGSRALPRRLRASRAAGSAPWF